MVHQLGDDFRVSFTLKDVVAFLKKFLDVLVVGDDPVMHYDKGIFVVGSLWMRVQFARLTVGCPTGVRNAAVAYHWSVKVVTEKLFSDGVFQNLDLSCLLYENDAFIVISIDGNSGRVIAAIFQSLESSDEIFENLTTGFRCQIVQVCKNTWNDEGDKRGEDVKAESKSETGLESIELLGLEMSVLVARLNWWRSQPGFRVLFWWHFQFEEIMQLAICRHVTLGIEVLSVQLCLVKWLH